MKKIMALTVSALIGLAACAGQAPSFDTDAAAETTFDGLVPIKNSRFRNAWADPDVDFKQYNKIILGDAEFEFRAVKKARASSTMMRSNRSEFWIADKDREKLIDTVTTVFAEELSKARGFTVTEERGPNTLLIVGALHDIVSRVPPDLVGAGEIYLASVGEATLVLEVKDSLSGETLFRARDRRRIERPGDAIEANVVTTWAEVRRWAQRWATRLRAGLESIHS